MTENDLSWSLKNLKNAYCVARVHCCVKEIDFVDMLFSIGFRTSCLLFPHHPGLMSNFLFPTFKQDTKLSMSMNLLIDLFPPNYTQTIFTID